MNIYTSGVSFRESANNLDNIRLKKQLEYLAQIISNVLQNSTEYSDTLYTIMQSSFPRSRMINAAVIPALYKVKDVSHSTVLWGNKSPLHFFYLIVYFNVGYYYFKNRNQYSKELHSFSMISSQLEKAIDKILPINKLSNMELLGLDSDLYRNTPESLEKENNTIVAYQKYLIMQWKADILKKYKYNQALVTYKALKPARKLEVAKPRLIRKLNWGGSYEYPTFAKEELKKYEKELINA